VHPPSLIEVSSSPIDIERLVPDSEEIKTKPTSSSSSSTSSSWSTKDILIIIFFIILWTVDSILIHSIKDIDYDRASVTISIEIFKMVVSIILFFYTGGTIQQAKNYFRSGILFRGTGLIYCLYNLIRFYSLTIADPGTYRILLNLRILFTGILSQLFLKDTKLNLRKWIALVLLVIGCTVIKWGNFALSLPIFFAIIPQALLSAAGGVYSEVVLKKDVEVNLNLQNIYLYVFTISFNAITIVITDFEGVMNPSVLFRNWTAQFGLIVVIGALGGFMTALMLKNLGVIMKEYANGGEMLLGVLASSYFFGTDLQLNIFFSFAIVMGSVVLFYWERYV